MNIRTRYQIGLAISSSYCEEKDLGNPFYEVVTDTKTKGGGWRTVVPASTTNLQLQMDNLTNVQFILIRITPVDPTLPPNAVSFMLNSTGNTPIVCQPVGDIQQGHLLLTTTGITALYATNSGTTDMAVSLFVSGD